MKSVLKLALGIAVLLVAIFVFFHTQSSSNLDKGSLKHWLASSNEQRIAAVKIAVAGEGDIDLIVACVNKIAAMPNSNEMDTQTAITLCHTGNLLKENI
ncbi:MAG: hypothetical protein J6S74_01475 [Alphaproteobacteria bacterium]|nr:hypothetical protein [Alphaproteobacteria bacterium]